MLLAKTVIYQVEGRIGSRDNCDCSPKSAISVFICRSPLSLSFYTFRASGIVSLHSRPGGNEAPSV